MKLADRLRGAKVYDLEQPRYPGMPIHPVHRPGYFYALHRRHRDANQQPSRRTGGAKPSFSSATIISASSGRTPVTPLA